MVDWLRELLDALLKKRKLVPVPIPKRRFEEIPIDPYIDSILEQAQANKSLDSDKS